MGGTFSTRVGNEKIIQDFCRKIWGKETILKDNIKVVLKEVGCKGANWISLPRDGVQ
jgi:hypothetical protein